MLNSIVCSSLVLNVIPHCTMSTRTTVWNLLFSIGIGKGKVHRCTGTEALYRLYGP